MFYSYRLVIDVVVVNEIVNSCLKHVDNCRVSALVQHITLHFERYALMCWGNNRHNNHCVGHC